MNGAFFNTFRLFPAEGQPGNIACRRIVVSPLVLGSTLDNITVPCTLIHSIEWDDQPSENVTKLLTSPSNSLLYNDDQPMGNPILDQVNGNMAILDLQEWPSPNKYWPSRPSTAEVPFPTPAHFSGEQKIAFLYDRARYPTPLRSKEKVN